MEKKIESLRGETEVVGDSEISAQTDPAISVNELEKVYGTGEDAVHAVNGVTFDIEPGTAVGILGPNGAGKTTVIKSVLSLVIPTSGSVRVQGTDVYRDTSEAFRTMGAMLEGARNTYWRLTVRENLEIFTVIGGHDYRKRTKYINDLLRTFGLEEKSDTAVRELSRGQKQKVTLACTMARDAEVIFLDEPTLGLDVESSIDLCQELRRLVREDGSTVVLSSHDMEVIQSVCDRVIIMNNGEIIIDDAVDNLLDAFNAQTYEIEVAGKIDSVRSGLQSSFGASGFERLDDTTRFEVTITDEQFYDLVDSLRAAGLTIHSFDNVDPNLEDIFLRVTDENTEDIDT